MQEPSAKSPILVAHRGYSGRYPENTVISYQAAYDCGARHMELDLQLTSDGVPMLHHDHSLQRMSGVELDIRDTTVADVKALRAGYPEQFKDQFASNPFTTFLEFCDWLEGHSEVTIFVEIKQESIDRFGIPIFLDSVYKCISRTGVESQCVLISFNRRAIEYSRSISNMRIGWVLPDWSEENRKLLQELKPEFLFCDKQILPTNDDQIWRGGWQWAVYNLDDTASAIAMANRGIPFIETNEIGSLIMSEAFN